MSTVVYAVVELGFTFAVSLFFAAIAIDRKTLLSSALAAVTWLASGVMNLMWDASGFGGYVCWIFFLVGLVFIGQLLYKMVEYIQESKNSRFEVSPI